MAIVQLPQARSSLSSPVPLQVDFWVEKITGFLQPDHLTNEWGVCGQFANVILFQSLFLVEIQDPIGLLLYSYPFCSRPKQNVDTRWSSQMAGIVFPYFPCIFFSAFSSAPCYFSSSSTVNPHGHAARGMPLFEKSCFYKQKGCKLLKQSVKVAN